MGFWAFVLPALLFVVLFVETPFFMSIYYSFCKWNGIDKAATFQGLKNYIDIFSDDKAIGALLFTLLYALCVVVLVNVLAIFIASLLESKIRGKGFFRAGLYVPNIISLIVIGFIWKFIFTRVFDTLFSITGEKLAFLDWSWLGDPSLAFVSVTLVTIWQALGFYVIVYVAGLQSVPDELLEAATIDGAGRFTRFFKVTLPMLAPSVTFCVFYAIANSFKSFELIFSLTGGGPGTATTTMALDIYKTAFNANQYGYGSAKSVLLFVVVAAITLVQITVFQKGEVEI